MNIHLNRWLDSAISIAIVALGLIIGGASAAIGV